jgi:hyperosmotically inducible periplasmic protein
MKKYLFIALAAFSFITLSQSCKKKMKDEDIQKSAMEVIGKMTDLKNGAVTVKDGVATINGDCADQGCMDKCKKAVEDAKIKGVKSIDWQAKIAPPPSMPTAGDADIQTAVAPLLKDIKGAAVTVANGIATVTGVTDVAKRGAIKQALTKAGAKNVEFK